MVPRKYIKGQNKAQRLLRQEVALGCPICRKAFLTYHHFDPPWRHRHHWDPEGIIALCREHHDKAEGGHYTKEYLRELKAGSYSVTDIKEHFPWARGQFIVRVGGLYCGGSDTVIRVDEEPVVQISTSDGGLLSVSFVLRSKDGQTVATMNNNIFELGPRPPADLLTTTTATRIKVWNEAHNIAVDVSLLQITSTELDTAISADRDRVQVKTADARSQICQQRHDHLQHLPPDIANRINEDYASQITPQSPEAISDKVAQFRRRFGGAELPNHFLEAHFSGDPVGHRVKSWAAANCTDTDGLISFLNFDNLSLHGRNRHIRIRNGIGNVDYNAAFDCDTAFAL